MGKMSLRQRLERDDRVRRGLDPYFKWARPFATWAYGQGRTRAERSRDGHAAGQRGRSAQPMAYNVRLARYLGKDPSEIGPGTDESRLTSAQRHRLDGKLRTATARIALRKRQGWTRAEAAGHRSRRRHASGSDPEAQRLARERAFAAQPDPRLRAADRAEAKRRRDGTHGHR